MELDRPRSSLGRTPHGAACTTRYLTSNTSTCMFDVVAESFAEIEQKPVVVRLARAVPAQRGAFSWPLGPTVGRRPPCSWH